MNDKVRLVSTAHHQYDGRNLSPGDEFEAIPQDARLLIAINRAKDIPTVPETPPNRPPVTPPSNRPAVTPPHQRGAVPPPPPTPVEPATVEPVKETPKREYKRRDLEPES